MSETSDLLSRAWEAVREAGLTEEGVPQAVQAVGLTEAVKMMRGDPVALRPGNGAPRFTNGAASTSEPDGEVPPKLTEEEFISRIAANTGASVAALERCFYLDEGEARISIPGVKLGKNTAERARAIAQLLIVGRGFGIPEDDTLLEVIRLEVIRLKAYDGSNFAAHLAGLTQMGYVTTGTGKNRKWRAKGAAIGNFAKFLDELLVGAGL